MGVVVMGILNVTPDSFSDGGRYLVTADAVAHGHRLIAAGADIVDVGGESTRPGAAPVPAEVERARVVPVVEALADHVRVSIDTTKPEVAHAAVDAGATIVNDVSASLHGVAAERGVGWVAMHRRGDPTTMQADPRYSDVVSDVGAHLVARAEQGRAAGIDEVWIDPGIGFGKTVAHNLSLLRHLDTFVASGFPVVVGTSRKSFLGHLHTISDRPGAGEPAGAGSVPADDRLEGSIATAVWAARHGVALLRVHDVRATVRAMRLVGDAA